MRLDGIKLANALLVSSVLGASMTLWGMYNDIQYLKYTKADKYEVDKRLIQQNLALTKAITIQESIVAILDSIRKDNVRIRKDVTDIKIQLGKEVP